MIVVEEPEVKACTHLRLQFASIVRDVEQALELVDRLLLLSERLVGVRESRARGRLGGAVVQRLRHLEVSASKRDDLNDPKRSSFFFFAFFRQGSNAFCKLTFEV